MITQLTPDIYRLQIPFSDIYTCIFLIRTSAGIVVYDTATYSSDIPKYLIPALQELGAPCCVVVSHNHGDHAGGLAAFHEQYPHVPVFAGSEACAERFGGSVKVLGHGDAIAPHLTVVAIPGHTQDAIGMFDDRTNTLISGDCLQAYGIYGKGKWGTSIPYRTEHLQALDRLEQMGIGQLYTAHHYEPWGNSAVGSTAVAAYIEACRQALADLCRYMEAHPEETPEQQAAGYAAATGLPEPPAKTMHL